MKKKFVSWRRVSTKKQGKTGLGLSAQQSIIEYFVSSEKGELIADFREVYTGKDLDGCKELQKAMQFCKDNDATLIIAKTDRFRNTIEALQVYDEMEGKIFFCDLPHTDKFTLTLFFALAEREALLVSVRTKASLNEKKKRGEKLGRPKGFKADKDTIKASCESRRNAAKNNAHNLAFKKFLDLHESKHGTIKTGKQISQFVQDLCAMDFKTATGMPFNEQRAWSMIYKVRKLYA